MRRYGNSEELHVRLPTKLIRLMDRAIRKYPEIHMGRSDFIRGAVVRRLKELELWSVKL